MASMRECDNKGTLERCIGISHLLVLTTGAIVGAVTGAVECDGAQRPAILPGDKFGVLCVRSVKDCWSSTWDTGPRGHGPRVKYFSKFLCVGRWAGLGY